MIAFLALLFILLVIYSLTKTKEGFNPMNTSPEHRINIPVSEIPSMLAPASDTKSVGNTVSEPATNGSIFPGCDVKPSTWPGMLPGPLPTAPYQQIAVGSPLPYQDTSLIKANRQQLINLLEMLKGFLAFEAQEISERSDPTIQLPLQTARTDFHVLQAEVEVLNRNPGIQPNMTLSHLNEISSNLAFLQGEVRLIGSAGPIQGPIYEFTKPVEGFTASGELLSQKMAQWKGYTAPKDGSGLPTKMGGKRMGETKVSSTTTSKSTPDKKEIPRRKLSSETVRTISESDIEKRLAAREEAGRATTTTAARATTTTAARNPKPQESNPPRSETITVSQSKAAAAKAAAQKGVADSILSSVVAANMPAGPSDAASKSGKSGPASFQTKEPEGDGVYATVKDLKDFILRINCESVKLSESGTSDDITNARIVALAKVKSGIKEIINKVKMDPTLEAEIPLTKAELKRAFPILGDTSNPLPQFLQSAKLPAGLASLFSPNMQNDPEVAEEMGGLLNKYINSFMDGISFSVKYTSEREAQAGGGCSRSEQFVNSSAEKKRRANSTLEVTGFPSLADLDNASNAQFTPMDSGLLISDRYAPLPSDAGRGPSRFDWKSRSKEIESQVKKRGLQPSDFGIMPPKSNISNDFSWRGYARMMCTRLQATMDPHLPVLCGCPPMDWPGWRNAQ